MKPACSYNCGDLKKFVEYESIKCALFTLFASIICFVLFLIYVGNIFNEINKEALQISWLLTAISNLIWNHKSEAFNNFVVIIGGPFISFTILFLHLSVWSQKRHMPKRV